MMKEKEIDALVMPWVNAWVAHLLSVWRATATVQDSQAKGESSSGGYDKVVITKNMETIDAFSSHVIPVRADKAYIGGKVNVMMQALWRGDGCIPQGLTMQNMYAELQQGSKNSYVSEADAK